ncbi:L-asparaginase, type II [Natronococcus amylolyticus DSM 10524]|uniref:L-asparaginase, type II n=1 Tax=Natronococcus amylolyticus DSM 10524 TaxID=1227497 RepID=L9X877_9EURY|nr:asparaginase domain-containing protein [Natronococcus amylolyticus]ELY57930.1 L-asparaginase, type II [Natronococcus amylolyticus DSM 10524]
MAAATEEEEEDESGEETSDSELPRLEIVGTGGTIANPSDRDGYFSPEELVEERPELAEIASISVTGVSEVASQDITSEILFETHDAIMESATSDDSPDGFVVTTGSNGNAEVAYFLNLALDTDIPVVLTAAQRAIGTPGTDSDKNLYDAARVAVSDNAEGRGVLQVANDEIHHSRDVFKSVASRPDGWDSPNFGRIGIVDGDEVLFYSSRERLSTTDTEFCGTDLSAEEYPLSDIYTVTSVLEANGELVDAAVDAGAKGIVAGVYPTGSASEPEGFYSQGEALTKAAEAGIPVVFANHGWEGRISGDDTYIGGDTLQLHKARLLLAFGVMESTDPEYLQEVFNTY